ncbi:Platinum sensitivity protein [Chytridiales sp. JEL 0842]|nr:Platinum sensitivity protein [Chytridiales sp. JEL 0842]
MYLETLIVWTEPNGTDLALSFQEASGCSDIWDWIEEVQKKLPSVDPDIDQLPAPLEDDVGDEEYRSNTTFILPAPTLSNIKEIEQKIVSASRNYYGRDKLATVLKSDNYIEQLLPLLEICEDMESLDDLYSLSAIMRAIIFLNDVKIYEMLLQDDVFDAVIGMLEYDRDFPNIKGNHREHMKQKASFKQAIPIPSEEIIQKIKQTYRVQFLKDVALARLLDDSTFTTLNSVIYFNNIDIVSYFQQNDTFLSDLFNVLSGEDQPESKKKDVVMFLHELCSAAKTLQVANRGVFYRSLGQHGLFAIFEYTLSNADLKIRLAATAIMSSILDHDPALIRSYCMAQAKQGNETLLDMIISRFVEEADPGLRSQIAEILRILLDNGGVGGTGMAKDSDMDEFLNMFYEKYMGKLVAPVLALEPSLLERKDELFEFIRKENLKSLVSNIVQNHKNLFSDVTYVDTFKSLVLRHEQNSDTYKENGKSPDSPPPMQRRHDGWGRLDEDEEAYFNVSDDENDAPIVENPPKAPDTLKASPMLPGLAVYKDDDSDEQVETLEIPANSNRTMDIEKIPQKERETITGKKNGAEHSTSPILTGKEKRIREKSPERGSAELKGDGARVPEGGTLTETGDLTVDSSSDNAEVLKKPRIT